MNAYQILKPLIITPFHLMRVNFNLENTMKRYLVN